MTCDSDGDAVFKGCESLWGQILPCAIGLSKPDDTSAQSCLKAQCCGQLKAAYSRTDALDYLACLDKCGGSDTCAAACDTSFPEAAAKFAEHAPGRSAHWVMRFPTIQGSSLSMYCI